VTEKVALACSKGMRPVQRPTLNSKARLVGAGVDDLDGLAAAAGMPLAIFIILINAAG
jgi:hypothetical protein